MPSLDSEVNRNLPISLYPSHTSVRGEFDWRINKFSNMIHTSGFTVFGVVLDCGSVPIKITSILEKKKTLLRLEQIR